jgi:hypothetical protein
MFINTWRGGYFMVFTLKLFGKNEERGERRCGKCIRTGHNSRNCTREAWQDGDLWPPVQSDSEEEEKVEEKAEEQATEEEEEEEEDIERRKTVQIGGKHNITRVEFVMSSYYF